MARQHWERWRGDRPYTRTTKLAYVWFTVRSPRHFLFPICRRRRSPCKVPDGKRRREPHRSSGSQNKTMQDFWQAAAAQLERELTPQQFKTRIKPLAPVAFDEEAHTLRIAAPNRFKLDWVKSQFASRITALACEYWEADVSDFVLDPTASGRAAAYAQANGPAGAHGTAGGRAGRWLSGRGAGPARPDAGGHAGRPVPGRRPRLRPGRAAVRRGGQGGHPAGAAASAAARLPRRHGRSGRPWRHEPDGRHGRHGRHGRCGHGRYRRGPDGPGGGRRAFLPRAGPAGRRGHGRHGARWRRHGRRPAAVGHRARALAPESHPDLRQLRHR